LKLFHKTLLAVALTIVVLVGLLSVFWRDTLLSSYAGFEKVETTRNVERALDTLKDDVAEIDARLNDWAAWDSNWRFMIGQEPGFVADNYPDPVTLRDLGIHAAAHVFPDGRYREQRAIPREGSPRWTAFPKGLAAELTAGKPLVSHGSPSSHVFGFLRTPEGLMQVASQPIVRGDHTGEIRGALVFATYLTQAEIDRLGELIHIPFEVDVIDAPGLSPAAKAAVARLSSAAEDAVEVVPVDEQTVSGYGVLRDLYGKPAVVVSAKLPRNIYTQGQETVKQSLGLLVLIGLLFGLLNMLMLKVIVLGRLGRLSEEVTAIGSSGEMSSRVTVAGADEIATVADKLNGMLGQLQKSQAAVLELEAWRKGEQRYTELMDGSPTIVLIVTDDEVAYANPMAARLLAASGPADLVGRSFLAMMNEESREKLATQIGRLAAKETDVIRMEVVAERVDGSRVELELAANLLTFRDRTSLQVLAQDVTENNRVQSELSRMGKEMEIATRIQTALVPIDMPIERFDLAMELITAAEVGGDLIDYIPQPDGRFWLAIGDVTGHGLTPGLVMMMAQSMITGYVLDDPGASPAERLVHINEALFHNVRNRLRNDNYMTLQLLRHEGEGRFVAAGMHCDLVIWRAATRTVERLEVPGFWTGLLPDTSEMTQDFRFELGPLDVLLLYSDGLIEAANDEDVQYDMDRLEAALAKYATLPVDEIKARILEEVQGWLKEQLDDISLIVLRRHAEVRAVAEAVQVVLS
jgi:PAS domain S-box-containing protein